MDTELKKYQLSCFFSPILDEKQLSDEIGKIKNWIQDNEGATESEKISRKNLGYKIKHFQDAFYVLMDFKLLPEKISELYNKLKLNNDVLRILILNAEQKKEAKLRKKKEQIAKVEEKTDLIDEIIMGKDLAKEQTKIAKHEEKVEKRAKVDLADLDKKLDEILNE